MSVLHCLHLLFQIVISIPQCLHIVAQIPVLPLEFSNAVGRIPSRAEIRHSQIPELQQPQRFGMKDIMLGCDASLFVLYLELSQAFSRAWLPEDRCAITMISILVAFNRHVRHWLSFEMWPTRWRMTILRSTRTGTPQSRCTNKDAALQVRAA